MGKAIHNVEGWHRKNMVFDLDLSEWKCFKDEEKAEE